MSFVGKSSNGTVFFQEGREECVCRMSEGSGEVLSCICAEVFKFGNNAIKCGLELMLFGGDGGKGGGRRVCGVRRCCGRESLFGGRLFTSPAGRGVVMCAS